MKKNLFWSMLAMSGMLFATSCSQDELVNESTGDFVNATFNIGAVGSMGTRAIGEGTYIDKVACAVYDANGKEMDALYQIKDVDNGTATYSVRLAKGQNYRIAFFAYNSEADAYDVADLTNIKVKSGQSSNIEKRDAFTAYYDVETGKTMNSINETVELYRPFAQLNLGVNNEEYQDAKNAGVVIEKSYIKVSNVHNAFSAYHNAVVAGNPAQTMEFALDYIPRETLLVDTDNDGTNEQYHYLALNYLLVGDKDAEKELTDVEFAWETIDGKKNNPTTKFYNIPVQRNYRTNIIGKLLTSPADFNIVIKPAFDGDKNENITDNVIDQVTTVVVDDMPSFQQAINDAENPGTYSYQFTGDIDGTNGRSVAASITIPQKEGVNIVIDGNGYKFDGTFYLEGAARNTGNETLTFKNINFVHSGSAIDFISANETTSAARYAHNVTIDNCTFTGYDNGEVMGLRYRQTYNMVVKNSTFTNMYGVMWATGCVGITIDNVTVTNSKNGISLGTSTNVVINNANIDTDVYGIRANGEGAYNLTVENTAINANQPIIVRKTTGAYSVALEGTNTLTTAEQYHIVFTNGADDADYVAPTGAYSITGAENFNVYPADANKPMIADTEEKLNALLADNNVTSIALGADINATIVMKSNKTIIGNGYLLGAINLNGANNVTLKDITFDAANAVMGYDGSGKSKQYANIITGDTNKPKKGAHNLVIDGCTFEGKFANGGASIAFTDQSRSSGGSGNITIKNCTFDTENAFYSIYGHYTGNGKNGYGDFVIEGNTFKTTFTQGGTIYLGRYASSTPVVVKGNIFRTVTSLADAVYVQDHSDYGVSVNAENNTFAE